MADELIAGRYRPLGTIGEGGMGEVIRAEDTLAGAEVCLKRTLGGDTRSALVARMSREFQAGQMVAHPHLLSILDLVRDRGQPVLVMELIRGPTLEQLALLSAGRGLRASGVVALGRQLASGLAFFHRWVGEKHRDIKPANILIEPLEPRPLERWSMADLEPVPGSAPTFRAMIADFGLVTGAAQISRSDALPPGTARFMAPELLDGDGQATFASDLYALGRTLECAALGVPVPPGPEPHPDLRRLLGDRVGRVLNALLAPDPAARIQSAAALEQEFIQIENASAPAAAADQGGPRTYWRRALLADILRICDAPPESGGRVVLLRGPLLSGRATLLRRVAAIVGAPITAMRATDPHPLLPLTRLARSILAQTATLSRHQRARTLGADEAALRMLAEIEERDDLPEEAAREMAAAALGRVLTRHFDHGSPVLVLQHLDRAAPATIRALDLALRECSRLTLVASIGVAPPPAPLQQLLAQARRRWWEVREIDAGEVPPAEAARWLRMECEGLADEEALALAPEILRWFGHGARALTLGLRSLHGVPLRRPRAEPEQTAGPPAWPRPPRLLRAYRQALSAISAEGRAVLAALTLTEIGLTREEIAIGLARSGVDGAVEELRIAGLIRDAGVDGALPSLVLSARLLREEIDAGGIDPARFHRRVAEALARAEEPQTLRKCAYHLEQAGRPRQAAKKLCQLAGRLATTRPAEALDHRLRALELDPDPARRPGHLLAAAEVAIQVDLPRAEALLRTLLDELAQQRAASIEIECRARAGLIVVGFYTAQAPQMQPQLEALDALGVLPAELETWRLVAHAVMAERDDPAAAIRYLDQCPPPPRAKIGSEVIWWVECRFLALIHQGAYREASRLATTWYQRALGSGHSVAMLIFQRWAARAESWLGHFDAAERLASAALELAQKTGAKFRLNQVARELANIVQRTGRTDTAWRLQRLANSVTSSCLDVQKAITQFSLAGLYWEEGDLEAAERYFQRAGALFEALHHSRYWLSAQASLVRIRLSNNNIKGAREAHAKVGSFIAAQPAPLPSELRQFVTWARIYEGILLVEEGRAEHALPLLLRTRPSPLCGAGYLTQRAARAEGLCSALARCGESAAAERIARHYVRWTGQPDHAELAPRAHLLLARVLIDTQRYADALGAIRHAHGIAVARRQRSEEERIFATAARAYREWGREEQHKMCRAMEKVVLQWPRQEHVV